VPVPFVGAAARAVIVTVPAAGVFAARFPTFQRTIVPDAAGITVGVPSDGEDVLETYEKPAGSVSWSTVFRSVDAPVFP